MMYLIATLLTSVVLLLLLVAPFEDAKQAARENKAMRSCYLGEPFTNRSNEDE